MSKRKVEEDSLDEIPSKRFRSSIVKLNVGGKKFETSLDTLKSLKGTYFYALFSSNYLIEDEYFIDRDPTHFMAILNFLRTKKIILSKYSAPALEEIFEEAKYYSIEPLVKILISKVACKTIRVKIPRENEFVKSWSDKDLTLDIKKSKEVRDSRAQYLGYKYNSGVGWRNKTSKVSIYYDSDTSRWKAHIQLSDGSSRGNANFKFFSQKTDTFHPIELKWYESVEQIVEGVKKVSLKQNKDFKVDLPGEKEGSRVEESLRSIATSLSQISECAGSNNNGVFQIGGMILLER